MQLSEDEWKKRLSTEQYSVLREKGTEVPFSGHLLENRDTGSYSCAACGAHIFKSEDKYDSTTPGLMGWPSFADVSRSSAVKLAHDASHSMQRVEVQCAACGGHLGHLFNDESAPTGQHYCINSCALDFNSTDKRS